MQLFPCLYCNIIIFRCLSVTVPSPAGRERNTLRDTENPPPEAFLHAQACTEMPLTQHFAPQIPGIRPKITSRDSACVNSNVFFPRIPIDSFSSCLLNYILLMRSRMLPIRLRNCKNPVLTLRMKSCGQSFLPDKPYHEPQGAVCIRTTAKPAPRFPTRQAASLQTTSRASSS